MLKAIQCAMIILQGVYEAEFIFDTTFIQSVNMLKESPNVVQGSGSCEASKTIILHCTCSNRSLPASEKVRTSTSNHMHGSGKLKNS